MRELSQVVKYVLPVSLLYFYKRNCFSECSEGAQNDYFSDFTARFCISHYQLLFNTILFRFRATVSWDVGISKVVQDALNVFHANFNLGIYLSIFSKNHIIRKFQN